MKATIDIHLHLHGDVTVYIKSLDEPWEKRLDLVLAGIETLKKQGTQIMSDIKTNFTAVAASLTQANTALTNIQADEAKLALDIQSLKDQIASGGSTLTAEDQAALDDLVVEAKSLADKTQAAADAIPDAPPVVV